MSDLATETGRAERKTPTLEADTTAFSDQSVSVRGLDSEMMRTLGDLQQANSRCLARILYVTVVDATGVDNDTVVSGHHRLIDGRLTFTPHFGFEPATRYRARFKPPGHAAFRHCTPLTLDIPISSDPTPAPEVLAVFPSGDRLPANLLRFYVRFSIPMRRGYADNHIRLLDSDGRAVPDALYRAPVELWDRDMRSLTVLLDPGRLKRGVGPNRTLGPPLHPGQEYTLLIGAGMIDSSGNNLARPVAKRFVATEPARHRINIHDWVVNVPAVGTLDPAKVNFPAALDRNMLAYSIRLVSQVGRPISGHHHTAHDETRWCFTPFRPWAPGHYRILVSPELEDICGNSLTGAFDRDATRDNQTRQIQTPAINFTLS